LIFNLTSPYEGEEHTKWGGLPAIALQGMAGGGLS